MKKKEKGRDMGIGKLGDANIRFLRSFRWTLHSDQFDESLIQDLDINYKKKIIKFRVFQVMENGKVEVIDLKDIGKSNFILHYYDGCGMTLQTKAFSGLKLLDCYEKLDYNSSDVVSIWYELSYAKVLID